MDERKLETGVSSVSREAAKNTAHGAQPWVESYRPTSPSVAKE
jgi:hypothetical protein